MILPTEKRNAVSVNPRFLVYFGKPKVGKTTLAAGLEDNLIIDLEKGTYHLSALVMEASSVKELSEIAKAIADKNKELGKYAYKRITIDNGTKLEEMILPLALQLYRETPKQPMGRILETLCVKLLKLLETPKWTISSQIS